MGREVSKEKKKWLSFCFFCFLLDLGASECVTCSNSILSMELHISLGDISAHAHIHPFFPRQGTLLHKDPSGWLDLVSF